MSKVSRKGKVLISDHCQRKLKSTKLESTKIVLVVFGVYFRQFLSKLTKEADFVLSLMKKAEF